MKKFTLQEMINNGLVWNKEKVKIEEEGEYSRVDRIEFLAYDYEDCTVDSIDSFVGVYNGKEIPILIIHVSKED